MINVRVTYPEYCKIPNQKQWCSVGVLLIHLVLVFRVLSRGQYMVSRGRVQQRSILLKSKKKRPSSQLKKRNVGGFYYQKPNYVYSKSLKYFHQKIIISQLHKKHQLIFSECLTHPTMISFCDCSKTTLQI